MKERKVIFTEGIELNRVYFKDCMVGMKGIPDQSVDAIICDLPFGTTGHHWDTIIPIDELWAEYNRIIKPEGNIVLFSVEPFSTKLKAANLENLRYEYIWDKRVGANFKSCHTQPLRQHEIISVFKSPNAGKIRDIFYFPQNLKRVNKKMKVRGESYLGHEITNEGKEYVQEFTNYPKSILHYDRDEEKIHPTQKPVALLEHLIKTYTLPGGIVLDNCMGSFSTAVAAMNTGRYFIGFENDEKIYKTGMTRLANYMLDRIGRPMDTNYYEDFFEKNEDYFISKGIINVEEPQVEEDDEEEDILITILEDQFGDTCIA